MRSHSDWLDINDLRSIICCWIVLAALAFRRVRIMDLSGYNGAQQSGWNAVNRVATAQFIIFYTAESALKRSPILDKTRFPGIDNMLELLQSDHSWDFMLMGNFMRLGGELEIFLGHYYAEKKGVNWREVKSHLPKPFKNGTIFQRVRSSQKNNLIDLYRQELGIDLAALKHFRTVQEYFVHRHLYVHQTGLVDRRYLEQIEEILGSAERQRIEQAVLATGQAATVEEVVVYWFEPLKKRFRETIEEAKAFILELPP